MWYQVYKSLVRPFHRGKTKETKHKTLTRIKKDISHLLQPIAPIFILVVDPPWPNGGDDAGLMRCGSTGLSYTHSEHLLSTNVIYTHMWPLGYLHLSPPVQMAFCLLMNLVQLLGHGRKQSLWPSKCHFIAECVVHMALGSCPNTWPFLHWNQKWRGNPRASTAKFAMGGRVWDHLISRWH